METNLALTVGFKGLVAQDGKPIFNHDGAPLTVGGIIDTTNTQVAYFGRVVSEATAAPNQFLMGASDVCIGVLQNDNAINENSPAKPNYLLPLMPATAIVLGPFWLMSFTHVATGALTTPVRGCIVIYKDDTGQIEFLAAGAAIPNGYHVLNAKVMAYYPDTNSVLMYMGLSDTELQTSVASSTKKLNYFGVVVAGSLVVGSIVESTGVVAITVPNGTNVTALVAQFDHNGDTIKIDTTAQVSGVTANNFTSAVDYVVTAADDTTKTYTVTVTEAAAG
jgi:hypothetical protein